MLSTISDFWKNVQYRLFPLVEEETGPLRKAHLRLVAILEFINIEKFVPRHYGAVGRPRKDRINLARAFVAKVLLKLKYTSQLREHILSDKQLRRICGWASHKEVPSESKFSRAFREFAESNLPELAHESLIRTVYQDSIVGHLKVDSTPVEAREKEITPAKLKKKKGKPGRPPKGEVRAKKKTRSERQASEEISVDEMLAEIPKHCAVAMKKKPGLSNYIWKGYKLHLAVDDLCVPLVALVTSASVNDHEVAIPLTLKAEKRFAFFYELMDSAYDVDAVQTYIRSRGHVPIVDKKPYNSAQKVEKEAERKRRKLLNWYPADTIRYRERFQGERPNSLLKEYYGAGDVQYKGYTKVTCHLMFGVLVLAANTLLGFG